MSDSISIRAAALPQERRSHTAPTELVAAGTAGVMGVSAAIPSLIPKGRADRLLLGGVALAAGAATGTLSKRAVDGVDRAAPGDRVAAQAVLGTAALGAGYLARIGARQLTGHASTAVAATGMAMHLLALGTGVSAAADGVSHLTGTTWTDERAWSPDPKVLLPAAAVVAGGAVAAGRFIVPKLAGGASAIDPAELAFLTKQAELLDARSAAGVAGGFTRVIGLDQHDYQGLKFLAGRANVTPAAGESAPKLGRVYDPIRAGVSDADRLDQMMRQIIDNGLLDDIDAILVEVPTGSGAHNTARSRAFEHMHGGRTLVLARQYSAKRSVESYPEAPRAGRLAGDLLERLQQELARRGDATKVFAGGESLGAGALNAAGLKFADLGVDGALQLGTPSAHAKLANPTNRTQGFSTLDDVAKAEARVTDWDAAPPRSIEFRNVDDPVGYVEPRDAFGGGSRRPGAAWWQDRLPVTAGLKKILDLKNSTNYANEPGVFPPLEHHNYREAVVDHELLQLAFGTNRSAARLDRLAAEGGSLKALVSADEIAFAASSSI